MITEVYLLVLPRNIEEKPAHFPLIPAGQSVDIVFYRKYKVKMECFTTDLEQKLWQDEYAHGGV